jgi:hypothetical protein
MYNCGIYNEEFVQANLKKLENIGKLKLMMDAFDDDVLFTRKQLIEEEYLDANDVPAEYVVAPTFKKDVIVQVDGRKIVATKYYYNKSAVCEIIQKVEDKCREALKDMTASWESDVRRIDNQINDLQSRKESIITIQKLVKEYLA